MFKDGFKKVFDKLTYCFWFHLPLNDMLVFALTLYQAYRSHLGIAIIAKVVFLSISNAKSCIEITHLLQKLSFSTSMLYFLNLPHAVNIYHFMFFIKMLEIGISYLNHWSHKQFHSLQLMNMLRRTQQHSSWVVVVVFNLLKTPVP